MPTGAATERRFGGVIQGVQIMSRTSRGGPEPFEDFYRTHHASAVRWATALVGSRAVGEDLAQDALLRVGQSLYRLDNPTAYLRVTVARTCASWHRSHGRELRRDQAARPVDVSVSTESGELLDALAVLPYNQRAAIVLRYWADWPEDEIAAALDCRPTTVRTLVHRGLAALRREIEP